MQQLAPATANAIAMPQNCAHKTQLIQVVKIANKLDDRFVAQIRQGRQAVAGILSGSGKHLHGRRQPVAGGNLYIS
jgi:hypothetical protein